MQPVVCQQCTNTVVQKKCATSHVKTNEEASQMVACRRLLDEKPVRLISQGRLVHKNLFVTIDYKRLPNPVHDCRPAKLVRPVTRTRPLNEGAA